MSIADASESCLAAAAQQGRGVTPAGFVTDQEHLDAFVDAFIPRPAQ